MPTELKPLWLPQLVEARRSDEQINKECDNADAATSRQTSFSTVSGLPSPVTPTFSHGRFGSSTSSVDDLSFKGFSARSSLNTSPPSTVDLSDSTYASPRFLPGVKEEPFEREEDYDMLADANDDIHRCCTNQPEDLRSSIFGLGVSTSYDFKDAFASDEDPWSRQSVKKRRGGDSPLSGIATRIGTRFPSFSRRWKGRKVSVGSTMDGAHGSGPLAASSRNSSTTHSTIDANDYPSQYATPYPSSPTSLMDGGEQFDDDAASFLAPIDLERANDADDDMETDDDRCGDRRHATTPLLPPLMVPDSVAAIDEECLQSPLQSPTIDTCGTFSIIHSPTEPRLSMTMTPVVGYMPSPPLSTQPSVSSLRYPTGSTTRPIASQLVPCDDIPQMKLADPEDEWSQKLGHANFDIHPEPYRPADLDSAEGRQHFHASWALARCSYTKHLVRTGEHYGATSITHQLTEQKWSEIDARWRAHNEELIRNNAAATGGDTVVLREETAGAATVVGIPSFLNELSAEGKFPRLGDQVIVGPMEQIASQLQRKRSRKQTLMKFIHDVKVPNIGFGLRLGRKRSKTQ